MILNKLLSLSLPRLLHVGLSLLCVLALALGLASGALAAPGDSSGNFNDFVVWYYSNNQGLFHRNPSQTGNFAFFSQAVNSSYQGHFTILYYFPFPVVSGVITHSSWSPTGVNVDTFVNASFSFYDADGTSLGSSSSSSSYPFSYTLTDSSASFLLVHYYYNFTNTNTWHQLSGYNRNLLTYTNFIYDTSSSSGDLSDDILDGISAIAQSLLDLETGPYYGVSDVTVDPNGDLQHTLTQNASLEDLLNALGIAGTDTNHVIRGIYNNFGSYFTLYSIDDSTSSTTQVYRGLPQYVNALGQSVTDGINRLQRDHDLLYMQTAGLSDALYADTDTSPIQSWSVAEWLKGIYTSITSFISSFWSPAETDLKEAAEEGMQEAADRGIAGSADQVGDMDDLGSGFSSFGDTGNVGAGDILNSLTSGDYSFFSETTQDNLSFHPPVSENRGLRSSPSDPVEYVDELSRNRDFLREVLGLP